MHDEVLKHVRRHLRSLPRTFPQRVRVAEFGAYDINGSPIESVKDCVEGLGRVIEWWVGIDAQAGKGVDLVGLAHEIRADQFPVPVVKDASRGAEVEPQRPNIVLCLEMLEHDPHWDKSLVNMLELLEPGGVLVATWASPKREPHELEMSPSPGHYNQNLDVETVAAVVDALKFVRTRSIQLARDAGSGELDVQMVVWKHEAGAQTQRP